MKQGGFVWWLMAGWGFARLAESAQRLGNEAEQAGGLAAGWYVLGLVMLFVALGCFARSLVLVMRFLRGERRDVLGEALSIDRPSADALHGFSVDTALARYMERRAERETELDNRSPVKLTPPPARRPEFGRRG